MLLPGHRYAACCTTADSGGEDERAKAEHFQSFIVWGQ